VHGSEEEDAHDREEEHAHDSEEDACGRELDHWNANGDEANQVHSDSRSPMLDTSQPCASFWMAPRLMWRSH
jgi:hypothetical protein